MGEIVGLEQRGRIGKHCAPGGVKIDSTAFYRTFGKSGVLLIRRDPADVFCRYDRSRLRRLNDQQPRCNAPQLAGAMTVPGRSVPAGMKERFNTDHIILTEKRYSSTHYRNYVFDCQG